MKLGLSSSQRGLEATRQLTEEFLLVALEVRTELALRSTGQVKPPLPKPTGSRPGLYWDKTGIPYTHGYAPLRAGYTTSMSRQDSDVAVLQGPSLKPTQAVSTKSPSPGRLGTFQAIRSAIIRTLFKVPSED